MRLMILVVNIWLSLEQLGSLLGFSVKALLDLLEVAVLRLLCPDSLLNHEILVSKHNLT